MLERTSVRAASVRRAIAGTTCLIVLSALSAAQFVPLGDVQLAPTSYYELPRFTSVEVDGDRAYCSRLDGDTLVVDVSNPFDPAACLQAFPVGSPPTGSFDDAVLWHDDSGVPFFFVPGVDDLSRYSLDPLCGGDLDWVDCHELEHYAGVDIVGEGADALLYLSVHLGSLRIYGDLGGSPTLVGDDSYSALGGWDIEVRAAGDYVFQLTAPYDRGRAAELWIHDTSDPSMPLPLGSLPVPGVLDQDIDRIDLHLLEDEERLLVAGPGVGVLVYDVANPLTTQLECAISAPDGWSIDGLAAYTPELLVFGLMDHWTSQHTLVSVGMLDPCRPLVLGLTPTGMFVQDMAIAGGLLYAVGGTMGVGETLQIWF